MSDRSVRVPGNPPMNIHEQIEDDRKASLPEGSSWENIQTYRLYDRGKQASTLSPAQKHMLRGLLGASFSDNVLHKVVFEHAYRLALQPWKVEDAQVQAYLDRLWTLVTMPDFSSDVSYATVRDGVFAVGLKWLNPTTRDGEGRVVFVKERWWDGRSGVFVAFGDDGLPTYAVKEWSERGYKRRTVYFDDRIERYWDKEGGWSHFIAPDDDGQWPVPWIKRDGSPLHMPIITFAAVSDDDTPYGASIMSGGVLGLQDEINDIQRDITIAARMTAYQMYWATGVSPKVDEAGNPVKAEVGPGMMLENENPDAKYGVLAAGDMSQLLAAHGKKLQTVSYNTGTPLHAITGGDWPSGEALVRAEVPIVSWGKKMIESIGPSYSTLGHRSTEMFNVFGRGPRLNENALITSPFEPPEKRDELTVVQLDREKTNALVAKLALGFSKRALLREYGLSDAQITAMETERISEKTAEAEAGLLPGE